MLKKSHLIWIVPLLAVGIFFSFQLITSNLGEKENALQLNQTVFASQLQPNAEIIEHVSQKTAQKYVDFNVVIPKVPEGLENPITNVVQPPKEAVTDEEAIRNLTRIESYYLFANVSDEGVAIVQTNNEVIHLDQDGEALQAEVIEIDGVKINSFDCNCSPKKVIFWWYDEEVSIEVTIYGEKHLHKAEDLIKAILKG